jgi:hypothetical protein
MAAWLTGENAAGLSQRQNQAPCGGLSGIVGPTYRALGTRAQPGLLIFS